MHAVHSSLTTKTFPMSSKQTQVMPLLKKPSLSPSGELLPDIFAFKIIKWAIKPSNRSQNSSLWMTSLIHYSLISRLTIPLIRLCCQWLKLQNQPERQLSPPFLSFCICLQYSLSLFSDPYSQTWASQLELIPSVQIIPFKVGISCPTVSP